MQASLQICSKYRGHNWQHSKWPTESTKDLISNNRHETSNHMHKGSSSAQEIKGNTEKTNKTNLTGLQLASNI